ncbi:hypothetical protein [Streptomyces sp. NPDC048481]|uniref:hypothetical protein n=1 Tax=Streptomyces sp. NPDC048481 TaxID=3365557 RepID=UPI003712B5A5
MILSSEDAGIWILPVVFLLGAAIAAPVVCLLLAGRVALRVARSAAAGDAWRALTPGTWLCAAGSAACAAGCRFTVSLFTAPADWLLSLTLVCGCFALAAVAMAALTAALNKHLR